MSRHARQPVCFWHYLHLHPLIGGLNSTSAIDELHGGSLSRGSAVGLLALRPLFGGVTGFSKSLWTYLVRPLLDKRQGGMPHRMLVCMSVC